MRIKSLLVLFLAAVAAFADEENAVTPPEVASSNNLITSKRTPTADAPVFGTGSWFRRVFRTETRPRIELHAPVRLADFVVGDKIEMSLRNYIEAVLANNTEISISRLTIETPRNNILRQYSIFDPVVESGWTTSRANNPTTSDLEGAGLGTATSLSQPFRLVGRQVLPTGTTYTVGYTTTKQWNNNINTQFNPLFNSGLQFGMAQPLLRGRGSYLTKLPITIARSNLRRSEYQIQDQILRLVQTAELLYWDVIAAREGLRVAEETLKLYGVSLQRSQRELELGAISELEIFQPRAQYANAEIQVTQARFRLQQTEDILRRQISIDLDPKLRELPISLIEDVAAPVQISLERDELLTKALGQRPDVKAQRQALDVDDLGLESAANLLKPIFNLTGNYNASGRGGVQNFRNGSPSIPGGWGDSVNQLFGFGFPTYGFGVQLTLPIRDRRAAADYADAVVAKRLDTLRLRNLEQNVRLEVLNGITNVEQSRASVELAKVALSLAEQRVQAEQKRFDLGTSILFILLDAQASLSTAQSALVTNTVNYRRNITNLLRITGDLLVERGVATQQP